MVKRFLLVIVGLAVGLAIAGPSRPVAIGPAELYWLMNQACWYGDQLSVQMLLKAGADPTGVKGYTAFHKSEYQHGYEPSWPINQAALGGHAEVIRLLLAAGAKVDAPEDEGQTALMLAAHEGHMGVVKLLLEAGADKTYRAGPGEFVGTAEEVADRAGHKQIGDFIRSFGQN